MDAELKAKWLEALRSGEYAQTKNTLRDEKGFCCLGVLCDLVNTESWQTSKYGFEWVDHDFGRDDSCLPPAVLETFNIDSALESRAMSMNDDGSTFAEIADYIEKNT